MKIACVKDGELAANVAVECETCNAVLMDFDKSDEDAEMPSPDCSSFALRSYVATRGGKSRESYALRNACRGLDCVAHRSLPCMAAQRELALLSGRRIEPHPYYYLDLVSSRQDLAPGPNRPKQPCFTSTGSRSPYRAFSQRTKRIERVSLVGTPRRRDLQNLIQRFVGLEVRWVSSCSQYSQSIHAPA